MKLLVGGFAHETNTFSSKPTTVADFQLPGCWAEGEALFALRGTNTEIGGFIEEAEARGIELVMTVDTNAAPMGRVADKMVDIFLERLLGGLDAAPNVDGILLALHGAAVAEGDDDVEGLVLERVRAHVGPDMPVVVTLDLHAHVTQRMVDHATALVIYKTYPHIDNRARAVEAVRIMADTVEGRIVPTMALARPPMIPLVNMQFTSRGLAREFMEQLSALEHAAVPTPPGDAPAPVAAWSSGRARRAKAVSASLAMGFPWADIPHVGMAFVVCTDGDQGAAQRIADGLAAQAWARREEFVCPLRTAAEAVAEAVVLRAAGAPTDGPIVLPDMSDNPGGGGTSDGTVVLQELLAHGVRSCVVATIVDPEVVQAAHAAGVGARIGGTLGGKMDALHGPSLEFEGAVVRSVHGEGRFTCKGPMMTGTTYIMGATAVLELEGIAVIVASRPQQAWDQEIIRCQGLDPLAFEFIVLKSAVHFRGDFTALASHIVEVTGPGIHSSRLSDFAYRCIRRPLWPIDGHFDRIEQPVLTVATSRL
jgi:microcystin degradation protein MlrC